MLPSDLIHKFFTKFNFLGHCSFHCSKLVTWLSGTMYLLPGEVLIKCTKIKFQPIDWRESTTVGLQYKSFSLNKWYVNKWRHWVWEIPEGGEESQLADILDHPPELVHPQPVAVWGHSCTCNLKCRLLITAAKYFLRCQFCEQQSLSLLRSVAEGSESLGTTTSPSSRVHVYFLYIYTSW